MEAIDINYKFGHWIVVKRNSDGTWLCKCSCGNERNIPECWLLSGFTKSCGCKKTRVKDLRGRRFGILTAIEPMAERNCDGSIRWRCICDCGSESIVSSNHLLQNHTTSCGCRKMVAARDSKTFIDGSCLDILFSDKIRVNNTSGHTGVYKKRSKWIAYITVSKKRYWLGSFDKYDEAVAAREKAETEWKEKFSWNSE